MEGALSKKRVNLETIPPEVALNIAQTMGSWKEENQKRDAPKDRPYWLRGPTEGEKRKALLSLSKLSRGSNQLWTSILLQDVELEVHHLPSFLALIKKAPNVGQVVQRLRFTLAFPDLGKEGSWGKKESNFTRTQHAMVAVLDMRYGKELIPLDEHFDRKLLHSDDKDPFIFLNQVAIARGLILDALPNLQYLEVVGNTAFPFCKCELKDIKPLAAFVNLKEIKIIRNQWEEKNYLNGRNTIWILMLPNLIKANLAPLIDEKDLKFFLFHDSVLMDGISSIKSISLDIDFTSGIEKKHWNRSLFTILSACKKVEDLKITSRERRSAMEIVGTADITLELAFNADFGPFSRISSFLTKSLKSLVGDIYLVSSLVDLIEHPENSYKSQSFPSGLQKIRLSSNYHPDKEGAIIGGRHQSSGSNCTEDRAAVLLKLLMSTKSSREFTVISYRKVFTTQFNHQRKGEFEMDRFNQARSRLKKICEELSITLELWDEILLDDL